ncbi:MAG: hypothetical protein HN878_02000 [Candidatus Diapherotrites archaeon]|mgnify:CR=1 FL=1|jgi:hypothetical protein|nr:hypothetical protein [Candidatus Diapherotrites archaeon]
MKSKVNVLFFDDAKEDYQKLKQNLNNNFHLTLFNSINSKVDLLKDNYVVGKQIPKKRIPKKYVQKYGVTNLWKINLSDYWRIIYTLRQKQRSSEVEILEIFLDVLDIIDHKRYNKIFGYKKN